MQSLPKILATALTATILPLTSCSNFDSPEANSAATGGLIGAGAGAILSDGSLGGAAAGGALGAGAGYLYEKGKRH